MEYSTVYKKQIRVSGGKGGSTRTLTLATRSFASLMSSKFSKLFPSSVKSPSVHNSLRKTSPRLVSGFTLIETLISITFLSLAIAGALAAAQGALRAAAHSQNQTTAFYLAQDALEFVENKTLSNEEEDWLTGFRDPCVNQDPPWCRVSWFDDNDIAPCPPGQACGRMYINNDGFFDHNSNGTPTNFIRTVRVIPFEVEHRDDGTVEYGAEITAQVLWTRGGQDRVLEMTYHIFNENL